MFPSSCICSRLNCINERTSHTYIGIDESFKNGWPLASNTFGTKSDGVVEKPPSTTPVFGSLFGAILASVPTPTSRRPAAITTNVSAPTLTVGTPPPGPPLFGSIFGGTTTTTSAAKVPKFKVLLVGDGGTGKTTWLQKYVSEMTSLLFAIFMCVTLFNWTSSQTDNWIFWNQIHSYFSHLCLWLWMCVCERERGLIMWEWVS